MTDQDRLSALVAVWWEAIDSFTHLLEHVGDDEWATPTDLPGWDVHAIAAHTAHLEALLAGRPHDDVEVVDAPHAHGMMGEFTEQGVIARRGESADQLITEIRESATARHTQLLADPPTDPAAPAPGVFGAIGWTTGLLLRNRPLDVWMHEQDVRRALGRPGNLDSAPARHTADYLLESLPFIVAKRAGAPVGQRRTPRGGRARAGDRGRRRGRPRSTRRRPRRRRADRDARDGPRDLHPARRRASAPRRADDVRVSGDTELGERVRRLDGRDAVTWTTADIGDQTGRSALVTGPTAGRARLPHRPRAGPARRPRHPRGSYAGQARRGRRGASPPRCPARGSRPSSSTCPTSPSVRAAGAEAAALGPLHLLVNNAGIMATPLRRTADGLESQMATNHFGPFLLTGLLLDQLVASGDGRVVTLSSQMHRVARSAPLGDPRAHRPLLPVARLRPDQAGQPALHLRARPPPAPRRACRSRALAAHPGFAGTHLAVNGQLGTTQGRRAAILDAAVKAVSQSAAAGAWPTLMAATADLPGGTYVGPGGPGEASGPPRVVGTSPLARDEVAQRRLWETSEETVGLAWP